MTRIGPGDVAVPSCRRTPSCRPALTPPSSRGLAFARPAPGAPAIARAVFPGEESFKPGPGRRTARPGRLRLAGHLTRPRRTGGRARQASGCPRIRFTCTSSSGLL